MRCALAVLLLLTACSMKRAPRVDGGGAETLTPGISQEMTAPDNPIEGSELTTEERTVKYYDKDTGNQTGSIVERSTSTRIGASQDVAAIMEAIQNEWEMLVSSILFLLFMLAGRSAWRRGWPTMAGAYICTGFACLQWGPYAAPIGIAIAVILRLVVIVAAGQPNLFLGEGKSNE